MGMINPPTEAELRRIPKLLETTGQRMFNKIIYECFFSTFKFYYVAEYDPDKSICFGFLVNLVRQFLPKDMDLRQIRGLRARWGQDDVYEYSGWGDFPIDPSYEMYHGDIGAIRDSKWRARKAGDVEMIVETYRRNTIRQSYCINRALISLQGGLDMRAGSLIYPKRRKAKR